MTLPLRNAKSLCVRHVSGPAPLPAVVGGHLQDDVVEADEVLRPGGALAVVFRLLLQQGPLQTFGHVLVPPDRC